MRRSRWLRVFAYLAVTAYLGILGLAIRGLVTGAHLPPVAFNALKLGAVFVFVLLRKLSVRFQRRFETRIREADCEHCLDCGYCLKGLPIE